MTPLGVLLFFFELAGGWHMRRLVWGSLGRAGGVWGYWQEVGIAVDEGLVPCFFVCVVSGLCVRKRGWFVNFFLRASLGSTDTKKMLVQAPHTQTQPPLKRHPIAVKSSPQPPKKKKKRVVIGAKKKEKKKPRV